MAGCGGGGRWAGQGQPPPFHTSLHPPHVLPGGKLGGRGLDYYTVSFMNSHPNHLMVALEILKCAM